jgi:hypothetical protein
MSDEAKISRAAVAQVASTLYAILEKQECGPDKAQHIRGQIAGLRSALRLAGLELALVPVVRPIGDHGAMRKPAQANGDALGPPLY